MDFLNELKQSYPMFQIIASILIFIVYLIIKNIMVKVVKRRAVMFKFDETRTLYIKKTIRAGLSLLMFVLISIVWEISFEGFSIYIASFLTVVGVGLFASWSIVSNITASVILFFFFPLKLGSRVKIVDGDNSAEGLVVGLSIFSIKIKNSDGNDIYYPNNLAIQKSIVELKDKG